MTAAAIPALAMVWLLGTLAACYRLYWPLRDPKGPLLPAISETGIAFPGRQVYRAGFAAVALLLFCTIQLYSGVLMTRLQPPQTPPPTAGEEAAAGAPVEDWAPDRSVHWGCLAALGVLIQGIFVLETQLGWKPLLHFAGAIAFIAGTMQHAQLANHLLKVDGRGSMLVQLGGVYVEKAVWFRSCASTYGPVALMFLPLGSQFMSLGDNLSYTKPDEQQDMDAMGFMPKRASFQSIMGIAQLALVLNFAAYFASYGVDFWSVLRGSAALTGGMAAGAEL
eukprot:gnl/TRDRNA2_/TRDRNA2_81599_c0_seq1.p1 gnl/TRDRNA2_/TRDRNA2_81599_c0~~gnl/TRDRNA2_/TRDRNA2_81599_c0_seq1.p1  ORF type:complete len:306 (+),score=51.13 gnl/TRDRNA2_/TRDRNA2_81599_c0_seq1:84-920(+)